MRAVITLTLLVFSTVMSGQTLSRSNARKFLEKSWNYIKSDDTASFMNLWSVDDSISITHRRPHSKSEIKASLHQIRSWLDTAITGNMQIDHIDIEKKGLSGTDTKYWIQTWFRYNDHYYKGYGFYLANYKNHWVVRDLPSTSRIISGK